MNTKQVLFALSGAACAVSLGACLEAVTELPDAGGPPATDTGVDALSDVATDGGDGGRADASTDDTTTDATIDPSGIVINEVAPAGSPDDWFELYNTSDVAVDLTGWTFSDRAEDPRPVPFLDGSSVAPGGYLLVQFDDTYPGFGLGGADSLVVYGPDGEEVDITAWEEGAAPEGQSWGRLPNGTGTFRTLGIQTPGEENRDDEVEPGPECGNGVVEQGEECDDGDRDDGDGCSALCEVEANYTCDGGNPSICTADAVAPVQVVINEVKVTTIGDDELDWVEFYNRGTEPANIGGWSFGDSDPTNLYVFDDGAVVPAGGYLVIQQDIDFDFGLGRTDEALLRDAAGVIVDSTAWAEPAADFGTWGRLPNGTGLFQSLNVPTRGAANRTDVVVPGAECGNGVVEEGEECDDDRRDDGDGCSAACEIEDNFSCTGTAPSVCEPIPVGAPRVVVNEVKAQEFGDDLNDWIELYNDGDAAADLAGWYFSDNNDENRYTFAEGTMLEPGGFLVIEQSVDFAFGIGRDDSARLFDATGTIIDQTTWTRPAADTGTWGRFPDGTGAFETLATPTRGAANQRD